MNEGEKYAKNILVELEKLEMRALKNLSSIQRESIIENFNLLSDVLTESVLKDI